MWVTNTSPGDVETRLLPSLISNNSLQLSISGFGVSLQEVHGFTIPSQLFQWQWLYYKIASAAMTFSLSCQPELRISQTSTKQWRKSNEKNSYNQLRSSFKWNDPMSKPKPCNYTIIMNTVPGKTKFTTLRAWEVAYLGISELQIWGRVTFFLIFSQVKVPHSG
jgi:hypothetical protein